MNGTWKIPRGTSTIPEPGSLSTPSSSVSPPPPPLPLALSLHSSGLLKHFHSLSPHFLLPQRLFTCLVVGGLKARRWMQQLKIGRRQMKIWWDLIFLGKHSQNTGVVGGCQQTLLMKSYNTNRTEFQEKTPHTIHAYFSQPWTRGKGLREDEGLGWACENTRSVRQLREERGGGQEAGDGLGRVWKMGGDKDDLWVGRVRSRKVRVWRKPQRSGEYFLRPSLWPRRLCWIKLITIRCGEETHRDLLMDNEHMTLGLNWQTDFFLGSFAAK